MVIRLRIRQRYAQAAVQSSSTISARIAPRNSKACPDCGYSEFMETVQPQAPAANAGYRNALRGAPSDRKAMPAFVAGLLGFIMFMPPLSIAAVIMAVRGRKKEDLDPRSKQYYDIALALGVVGLVLFIMMFAVMIFGGAASVMSEYYRK